MIILRSWFGNKYGFWPGKLFLEEQISRYNWIIFFLHLLFVSFLP